MSEKMNEKKVVLYTLMDGSNIIAGIEKGAIYDPYLIGLAAAPSGKGYQIQMMPYLPFAVIDGYKVPERSILMELSVTQELENQYIDMVAKSKQTIVVPDKKVLV